MKLHREDAQDELEPVAAEAPPEESYSLEEIMREFGGWSKPAEQAPPEVETPAEQAPEPAAEAPTAPAEPSEAAQDAEPAEETPPEAADAPARPKFIFLDADQMPKQQVWTYTPPQPEPAPEPPAEAAPDLAAADAPQRRSAKPRPARPKGKKEPRREPARPARSPEEALRYYAAAAGSARARSLIQLILFAVAAYFALAERFPVLMLPFASAFSVRFFVMAGLLAAAALLSLPVLAQGIGALGRARIAPQTYLLVMLAAVCVEAGLVAYPGQQIPPFVVAQLALLLANWADMSRCIGCYHSLKAVGGRAEAGQIRSQANGWNGKRCIYLTHGPARQLAAQLEQEDQVSRVMSVDCAAALGLSWIAALLIHFLTPQNFLWAWTVILCGAFPMACLYCYARPFATLARRLQHGGAALCGWQGVCALSAEAGVVIRDQELFPRGTVALNGIKVYGEFRAEQMISYTATAIAACESSLTPLFETLMQEQGGHLMHVENFRTYEGGGVGAEITGDVVLVGSLSFMRLMGISMPNGTNLKQAVYTSINGTLAGVIAVNYTPAVSITAALQAMVRGQRLAPVFAVTDFVISPAMLHHKFKVPSERLEFPSQAERARLAQLSQSPDEADACAALLTRTTFAAYADTILGARSLRSVVRVGIAVTLSCGVLGLLLMTFLAWVGAASVATATNLLLFALIWMIPSLLVTSWVGRY